MKVNKDLMDALLMLSIIALVLVLTSDFENLMWKNIFLGISGMVVIIAIAGKVMGAKTNKNEEE